MNVSCYCFHKSGSMFFFRLFKQITESNDIDYYSENGAPPNHELWNDKLDNCILCPIRKCPYDYKENLKYIIHLRNPLDILISSYYSFGWTHAMNELHPDCKEFYIRREKIQSLTVDEYCLLPENIDKMNEKYDDILNWIKKYKDRDNVFISDYDDMYYNFPNWLRNIFDFLSLKKYNETLSIFEKEFKNSNTEHVKTDIKTLHAHHRSGLSKQWLVELKETTIDLVISKFSDNIKNNFDFK